MTGTDGAGVDLQAFFGPRSVAIVGASERQTSSGGAVLQMMQRAGYSGRIIPVNPKGGTINGLEVRTSLSDLSEPAELVVVAVRPDFIPAVIGEAAATGHRKVLILPGGFSEAGEVGLAREKEVREIAADAGMTIAGPNCAGIIDLESETRLAATFLRDLPPGGGIAFISQSGALAEEVIAASQRHNIPLGIVVSVGNAMQLGVEDYLEYLGNDPQVKCILLYFESTRDMDAMAALCRKIAGQKPIVALLPGKTSEGQLAAAAHTGSKVSDAAELEGFCEKAGVVRVANLREMMLAAKGFGTYPSGFGNRLLILSNSGGPGVLATDRAVLSGLELAPLPEPFAEHLRAKLPAEASIRNPLDLLADAREDRFGLTLKGAFEHCQGTYDAIAMIHVVPFMVDAGPVIDRLAELSKTAPIPVLHSMMGTLVEGESWFAKMEAAGVPMFQNVEDMAMTAGFLAKYGLIRKRLASS